MVGVYSENNAILSEVWMGFSDRSSVAKTQQLKENMNNVVSFYHIPSQENIADILTRVYHGDPKDLPYIGDCNVDTTQAVLYTQETTNVQSLKTLPEVNTKQIVSNQMNTSGDLVGVVSLTYLLH